MFTIWPKLVTSWPWRPWWRRFQAEFWTDSADTWRINGWEYTAQWKPGLGGLVCVAHVRKMPNPSAVIIIDIPAIFLALLVLSCSVSYTHRGSNCVLHPFCVFEAHRNYLLMKHIGPRCVLLTTDDPHRMTHNWTNHRAATTLATANRSPLPGPIAIPRLHSF